MQYFLIYLSFALLALGIVMEIVGFIFKISKKDNSKKIRLIGIILIIIAVLVFYLGDKLRVSMMKDEVLSYYNKNISYSELNEKQMRNIGAIFSIDKIPEKDREKYLPAFEFYLRDYYKSLGYDEDFIENSLDEFLYRHIEK